MRSAACSITADALTIPAPWAWPLAMLTVYGGIMLGWYQIGEPLWFHFTHTRKTETRQ